MSKGYNIIIELSNTLYRFPVNRAVISLYDYPATITDGTVFGTPAISTDGTAIVGQLLSDNIGRYKLNNIPTGKYTAIATGVGINAQVLVGYEDLDIGWGSDVTGSDIPYKDNTNMSIADKLNALESYDTTALSNTLNQIQEDITVLQSDSTEVDNTLLGIQEDITVLQSDSTNLQSDMLALQSDTSALQSDTSALQSDTNALENNITSSVTVNGIASNSLATALSNAVSGDYIHVKDGTHTGNYIIPDGVTIYLEKGVVIQASYEHLPVFKYNPNIYNGIGFSILGNGTIRNRASGTSAIIQAYDTSSSFTNSGRVFPVSETESMMVKSFQFGNFYRKSVDGKNFDTLVPNRGVGNAIISTAIGNGSVFVLTSAGVFNSVDEGSTWTNFNNEIPQGIYDKIYYCDDLTHGKCLYLLATVEGVKQLFRRVYTDRWSTWNFVTLMPDNEKEDNGHDLIKGYLPEQEGWVGATTLFLRSWGGVWYLNLNLEWTLHVNQNWCYKITEFVNETHFYIYCFENEVSSIYRISIDGSSDNLALPRTDRTINSLAINDNNLFIQINNWGIWKLGNNLVTRGLISDWERADRGYYFTLINASADFSAINGILYSRELWYDGFRWQPTKFGFNVTIEADLIEGWGTVNPQVLTGHTFIACNKLTMRVGTVRCINNGALDLNPVREMNVDIGLIETGNLADINSGSTALLSRGYGYFKANEIRVNNVGHNISHRAGSITFDVSKMVAIQNNPTYAVQLISQILNQAQEGTEGIYLFDEILSMNGLTTSANVIDCSIGYVTLKSRKIYSGKQATMPSLGTYNTVGILSISGSITGNTIYLPSVAVIEVGEIEIDFRDVINVQSVIQAVGNVDLTIRNTKLKSYVDDTNANIASVGAWYPLPSNIINIENVVSEIVGTIAPTSYAYQHFMNPSDVTGNVTLDIKGYFTSNRPIDPANLSRLNIINNGNISLGGNLGLLDINTITVGKDGDWRTVRDANDIVEQCYVSGNWVEKSRITK